MNKTEIRRGDVFHLDLPERPGCRIPVLVLQNDIGNGRGASVIVSPLTREKGAGKLLFTVRIRSDRVPLLGGDYYALLFQIYTFPREFFRGENRQGSLDPSTMREVDQAIKLSLGLSTIQQLQSKFYNRGKGGKSRGIARM